MPKEPTNVYAIEKEEPNEGWMRIKMQLLLEHWHFADFEMLLKASDPLFYIREKILEKHPRSLNIQIFVNEDKTSQLINYDLLLGEIFKTKGEKEEKDAKTFNLFYDFDPGTKNPLLLFLKNN